MDIKNFNELSLNEYNLFVSNLNSLSLFDKTEMIKRIVNNHDLKLLLEENSNLNRLFKIEMVRDILYDIGKN